MNTFSYFIYISTPIKQLRLPVILQPAQNPNSKRTLSPLLKEQKKTKEISEIIQELEEEYGTFAKGGVTIPTGGDIFIRPSSILQQEHLLSITTISKGTVPVTCSLPRSHKFQRVVIREVPTGDTNEKIEQALTRKR